MIEEVIQKVNISKPTQKNTMSNRIQINGVHTGYFATAKSAGNDVRQKYQTETILKLISR